MIVGGVFGVLLASLLSWLHGLLGRRTLAKAETVDTTSSWRPGTGEAMTVLYGALVTTVAIYLLQATTVAGFPVSISLCDPLGGVILGLFFKPVGQFIQAKIT